MKVFARILIISVLFPFIFENILKNNKLLVFNIFIYFFFLFTLKKKDCVQKQESCFDKND